MRDKVHYTEEERKVQRAREERFEDAEERRSDRTGSDQIRSEDEVRCVLQYTFVYAVV